MKQRTITAILFVGIMLGGIMTDLITFRLLFLTIAAISLWEFLKLLLPDEEEKKIRALVGVGTGMFPLALFYYDALFNNVTMVYLMFAVIYSHLINGLEPQNKYPFQTVGAYLIGYVYVLIPYALLYQIAYSDGVYAPYAVLGLFLLVWTNDTMAYLIGSRWGRFKLVEQISPKKTWEGTIGGGICTVIVAWALSTFLRDFKPAVWMALGVVVAIFGTIGDLVESKLKRSAGVKDSGDLLPGHGGLLDRFDAFQFMLPYAWLVIQAGRSLHF